MNKSNRGGEWWMLKMAWKDARFNIGRLILFISSIVIGVAALVAINAFNHNLQHDIDVQAKELLGADLVVSGQSDLEKDSSLIFLDSLRRDYARSARFASMVFFPATAQSRLIRVLALEGDFPFYGNFELEEGGRLDRFREGNSVLIDESLALQFGIQTGDSLRLGQGQFVIDGFVTDFPGNTNITTTFAPTVYLPYTRLEETGLIQFGSRVDYSLYYSMEEDELKAALERLKPLAERSEYSYSTVESQKENLSRGFQNLYRYFSLLSFVALVLGCTGVASSVYIYVREKRNSAAILRCLGASGWQIFRIFFYQIAVLGFLGSIAGIFTGIAIQYFLPAILSDFLPVNVEVFLSWPATFIGLITGMFISLLFSMLPLNSIRFVSPMDLIRDSESTEKRNSAFSWVLIFLIALFPLAFAIYQSSDWKKGTAFYLGLVLTFVLLYIIAKVMMYLLRRVLASRGSFIWRQGFSNLYRPNNQTPVLVVVIGLGAFLISTMTITQNSLLSQVEFSGEARERSNTVLFDIQPYQKDQLQAFLKQEAVDVQQIVPVVTMRIRDFKGKSTDEWMEDSTREISRSGLTREYRVTYRDSLINSEKLIKGRFPVPLHSSNDSILISISDGMANWLKLDVGDSIVFNVQGLPMKTYVGSIREVDWQRVQTNFMVVFPEGVLERAPQFFVMTMRMDSKEKAADFQQKLVMNFPNISLIDLNLILSTLDDIFSKVAFVIRFMALFSIITGMIVLSGAVINSKYARLRENVLLRTLGAVKNQIQKMTLVEYGYLGSLSAISGIALSLISSWILAVFFFEIAYKPGLPELFIIWLSITLLTMLIGWYNTRSILNRPPLEILRKEVIG
ncbi:MAG: ABC transporter permease [Cyclobacteriaceae bacterium]|nr:ABC transporter permease [Cyclobacteriaceae bacterium]